MDKQYFPIDIEEKWAKIWSERKVANTDSSESFSQDGLPRLAQPRAKRSNAAIPKYTR